MPQSVCGTFEEPEIEDKGQCSPYRVKITCDAPTLPPNECGEVVSGAVYDPITGGFYIISAIYDENCSAILDNNNDPITSLLP